MSGDGTGQVIGQRLRIQTFSNILSLKGQSLVTPPSPPPRKDTLLTRTVNAFDARIELFGIGDVPITHVTGAVL